MKASLILGNTGLEQMMLHYKITHNLLQRFNGEIVLEQKLADLELENGDVVAEIADDLSFGSMKTRIVKFVIEHENQQVVVYYSYR